MSDNPNAMAYDQAWQTYRHFSVMRLTLVTAYATVTNLLLIASKDKEAIASGAPFNCMLAIGFALLEWNFNRILRTQGYVLQRLEDVLGIDEGAARFHRVRKHKWARKLLPSCVIIGIYGLSSLFWIGILCHWW